MCLVCMRDRKEVICLELRGRGRLIKDKVQEVTWARWRGSYRLSWRPLNLINYLSSILLCKGENWSSKSWCNLPRIKQKQLAEPISPLLLHLSPPFPLYKPEYTCSHMLHSQTHTHTESHPHPPHCFQSSKTPSSSSLTIAVPSERNALLPALHLTSASLGPWFKCKDLREAFPHPLM